jgi:hypothetical protein
MHPKLEKQIRERAAELGNSGDPAALPKLAALSCSPAANVRRLAASAIGRRQQLKTSDISRLLHPALCQSLCLLDEGIVKGGEMLAVPAGGKVQGIGKIQALAGEINSLGDYIRPLDFHIRQAEGLDKGLADGGGLKIVSIAQNPFGFEDNGFRDEDIMFAE